MFKTVMKQERSEIMDPFISEEIVHVNGFPRKLVVFLHGYIDNCESLNRRIENWIDEMQDTAIHLPEAPLSCEIHPAKRQWYSMHRFDPDDERKTVATLEECTAIYAKMAPGFDESYRELDEYIDNCLNEYQLEPEDLYLCGFSQGAMLAIYTALRRPEKIGGCVSFSGVLATPEYFKKHTHSCPPFLLIHGTADNLVRYQCLNYTKEQLEFLNCPVETLSIPGESHRITEQGLQAAKDFICRQIIKKAAS